MHNFFKLNSAFWIKQDLRVSLSTHIPTPRKSTPPNPVRRSITHNAWVHTSPTAATVSFHHPITTHCTKTPPVAQVIRSETVPEHVRVETSAKLRVHIHNIDIPSGRVANDGTGEVAGGVILRYIDAKGAIKLQFEPVVRALVPLRESTSTVSRW